MLLRSTLLTGLWCVLLAPALAHQPTPTVAMETSAGTIVLQLDPEHAPESVRNFLDYVDSGFYEGLIFHRVIPGFMAQGGGFDTQYKQREPKAPITNESRNGLSNLRGTIAMARTGAPHSATSQFFINLADNRRLDASEYRWGYTVFGRVIEGMEVVDAIAEIPTGPAGPFRQDAPQFAVIINKMRRVKPVESAETAQSTGQSDDQ